MSIVASSSAFTPNNFHAKPLFSSHSAFKKPIGGLTPNKSPLSHKKLHETCSMTEFKGEMSQVALTDGEADIIFMEPVKKLKSTPEDSVQLFNDQPVKSTKLTIEDVFNKGAKKENGEGIVEEEEEDCSLSFISSDESLEDVEEKLVELKDNEQAVDESQEETQEETPEKEDKTVPEPEKSEKEAEEEVRVGEEQVLLQVSESDLKSLYAQEKAHMSMNPMSYMSDMKDLRAFNTQYNAMLNNMYQNNPYMSYQQYNAAMQQQQQQYQMLQSLQREQYSGYQTNYNSYVNNELLMAYNLSLNNVYNNFTHYPRSEMNYYVPSTVNPQEYSHAYNINQFHQLHPQYAELQRQQQQNIQNIQQRPVNFLDERRVKTSVFEEYADENESYTTTCAAESVSRDPESSDGNKSQKVYSPLIVENKEAVARSEITGVKRPLIEEFTKAKKAVKPKQIKESKNVESGNSTKKKRATDLKQDLNPGYLKVERRLNKLQLLRYQQGDFEGNEELYNSMVKFNESLDLQKNQPQDVPIEDGEQVEDLRADLPPFMRETDSQRGRKVKMVWTPEIMPQEELSSYIQKLGEVIQAPMINQQGAIKLLASCNLEVHRALEAASLDAESFKEYFRLKVEKKRGRRPAGFVENTF